jgi:protein O-mannosyl-transferase
MPMTPVPPSAKTQVGSILILISLVLLVYFNSLQGSFHFDDRNLIDREWVQDLEAFNKKVELREFANRPVLLWTFALNNTLHKNKVFGFHLLNLLLHALVSILVFVILVETQNILRSPSAGKPSQDSSLREATGDEAIQISGFTPSGHEGKGRIPHTPLRHEKKVSSSPPKGERIEVRGRSDSFPYFATQASALFANKTRNLAQHLPLFTALLFAVHPLNTDSVSYISSRSTVLATFFYLLSLYAFLRIFSPATRRSSTPVPVVWGLLSTACMYLAIASKLIAVTLPALLGLWFLIFIAPVRFPRLLALLSSRKMIPAYAGAAALLSAMALFVGPGFLYAPKDQGLMLFGRVPYLLIETKVIVFHYLKLFFAPINLNVDTGFPFTTFSTDPKIPLAILAIGALVYVAIKTPNAWFRIGIFWFLLTLMPTSSLVPLSDLAVEHRMYLPMTLGLCLIVGWAVTQIPARWGSGFMIVLIALLGMLTLLRNGVWTDEVRLWQDAVKKNPWSSRTHNNLGKAYYENGRLDEALFHFLKANETLQTHFARQYNLANLEDASQQQRVANLAEPHYNLASVYLDKGDLKQALDEYRTAIRLNPNYFSAYLGLGSIYTRRGQTDRAIEAFQTAIQKRKSATGKADYALARLNLGEVYGRTGKFADAIRELSLAVHHDPSLVPGHYNLGLAYLMTGRLAEAEQALTTCLALAPGFEPALFTLARVSQAKGEWQRSTRQFEKFLSVKGEHADAYYQIGWNYQQAGQRDDAVENYKKALTVDPKLLKAKINLGKLNRESLSKN